MAFRKNNYEQATLHGSFLFGLTEREQKVLEKSWAKIFANGSFPAIDWERFPISANLNKQSW